MCEGGKLVKKAKEEVPQPFIIGCGGDPCCCSFLGDSWGPFGMPFDLPKIIKYALWDSFQGPSATTWDILGSEYQQIYLDTVQDASGMAE